MTLPMSSNHGLNRRLLGVSDSSIEDPSVHRHSFSRAKFPFPSSSRVFSCTFLVQLLFISLLSFLIILNVSSLSKASRRHIDYQTSLVRWTDIEVTDRSNRTNGTVGNTNLVRREQRTLEPFVSSSLVTNNADRLDDRESDRLVLTQTNVIQLHGRVGLEDSGKPGWVPILLSPQVSWSVNYTMR